MSADQRVEGGNEPDRWMGVTFTHHQRCAKFEDGLHRVGLVLSVPYLDHQCLCGASLWPNGQVVAVRGESDPGRQAEGSAE